MTDRDGVGTWVEVTKTVVETVEGNGHRGGTRVDQRTEGYGRPCKRSYPRLWDRSTHGRSVWKRRTGSR